MNLMTGQVQKRGSGYVLDPPGWEFPESARAKIAALDGQMVEVGVRPEHIRLIPVAETAEATVAGREFLGDKTVLSVQWGAQTITALTEAGDKRGPGTLLSIKPDMDHIMLFDPESGHRLA